MRAERHRVLAERIERSVAHCGDRDTEMKIEAAMLAGTHWANYALHRHGVCSEDEDKTVPSWWPCYGTEQ
jgi:hypothetical protein